ncbi:MAG: ATP-binding protein [Bacteroidetes bacterium]|nr:ATP-binding protein [Bacteroidota bacterium]
MLYDIASFSNNQGGTIIYGIIEKEGEAIGIKSVDQNLDALILKMEMLVRDGIKPVISGVIIYGIDTGSGVVIVVEIPKSWNAPHMVTIMELINFINVARKENT